MKFATRYTPPPSPSITFDKPSMTDRSFRYECDINNIVARCLSTGEMPPDDGSGVFGDFAELPTDLMSTYDYIERAGERFMELPSDLRLKFNNDPLTLLQALHDPSNHDLMVEYGLINKPAPAASQSVTEPKGEIVSSQSTNVEKTPSDKAEN